jgi:uncharacterized membrane protein YhaH (DUF805 family)
MSGAGVIRDRLLPVGIAVFILIVLWLPASQPGNNQYGPAA